MKSQLADEYAARLRAWAAFLGLRRRAWTALRVAVEQAEDWNIALFRPLGIAFRAFDHVATWDVDRCCERMNDGLENSAVAALRAAGVRASPRDPIHDIRDLARALLAEVLRGSPRNAS